MHYPWKQVTYPKETTFPSGEVYTTLSDSILVFVRIVGIIYC